MSNQRILLSSAAVTRMSFASQMMDLIVPLCVPSPTSKLPESVTDLVMPSRELGLVGEVLLLPFEPFATPFVVFLAVLLGPLSLLYWEMS